MKFLVPFAALAALGRALLGCGHPASRRAAAVGDPSGCDLLASGRAFGDAGPRAYPGRPEVAAHRMGRAAWSPSRCCACRAGWSCAAALRAASTVASSAPVPVKSASSFLEPGLVGIWRPVILLPHGLSQQLTQGEMDAILAHELCHLRRRDNLLAAMHMLVEGLFWFHPLVWWIGGRLVEERERACDESVVAAASARWSMPRAFSRSAASMFSRRWPAPPAFRARTWKCGWAPSWRAIPSWRCIPPRARFWAWAARWR